MALCRACVSCLPVCRCVLWDFSARNFFELGPQLVIFGNGLLRGVRPHDDSIEEGQSCPAWQGSRSKSFNVGQDERERECCPVHAEGGRAPVYKLIRDEATKILPKDWYYVDAVSFVLVYTND